MKKYISLSILLLLLAATSFAQKNTKKVTLTSAALGKIEARHIGPAVMGGRITSLDGVNDDPRVIYVGTAGGGVWKTTNGGSQFLPVFDKFCQSIGDLKVDQTNPDIIWVGTGESNMRNSVSIGTGIYKSTDAGENWVSMGLEKTEHISEILIHPNDHNTLFVAVPGHLWDNSSDRGLYKTTDAGKTWSKIIFVNDSTGCADIAIHPKNPDIMYATTWQFRRKPYSFNSGGPGSAIYKSTDGGKTWNKIHNGLPEGDFGRVALAMAPTQPDKLVAIVESEKSGLYISEDGGANWTAQSADDNVTARPFYFATIQIDPENPNRVYRPAYNFAYSDDGGYSWVNAQNSSGWVHVDMHALWINPQNTSHMYLGTDGGVYMSVDRGNNWIFLNNMPLSQFYHVQVDDQEPYNVYGGLQDNGSWRAPSQSPGGIDNGDWRNVGGGDGFWVQPDREDHEIVYSEWQGGHISRLDLRTNQWQDIQPQPLPGEEKMRWNWNSPICVSPTNKKKLYTGSQYLYVTTNRGLSWERISPDLTTNDEKKKKQEESGGVTADVTSAENHCTIFTVAESPLDENIIWVGTDDGNLQLTLDAGKTWTNLATNYSKSGIPAQTWISSIEPSRFDKNVVYATFDNHMYGDMKTYLGKSTDMGKTWKMISSDQFKGFAHKIKEDLVSKDLLFLGTEMGLYVSIDGGKNWVKMKGKIPDYCLVRDIVIEPKTNDLVLGTHGRGILIVDDISSLRIMNDELLSSNASFLPSRPAAVTNGHYGQGWPDAGGFIGTNSNEQAMITYYLKDRVNSGTVTVQVYDDKGNFVVDLPGTKRKGINEISWDMRTQPPKVAEGGSKADWSGTLGPMVLEGKYKLRLMIGGEAVEGSIELISDPKTTISAEDRKKNFETVMEVYKMAEDLAVIMDSVMKEQNEIADYVNQSELLKEYQDSLEVVRALLVPVKEGTAITGEEKIRDKISELYWTTNFYEGRPTDSQLIRIEGLQQEMGDAEEKLVQIKSVYRPRVYAELKKLNPNRPY